MSVFFLRSLEMNLGESRDKSHEPRTLSRVQLRKNVTIVNIEILKTYAKNVVNNTYYNWYIALILKETSTKMYTPFLI